LSILKYLTNPLPACFYKRKWLTKSLKKQLKRRSAIEPIIGHMKQEGKLGLCRLKGIVGDHLNAC
jgi:transposase, IS5 family